MPGDVEYESTTKITLPSATSSQAQKEIGPVSLSFEIPMYSISGIQIKSLKTIQGNGDFNKWVRYITKTSSYVCRIWFFVDEVGFYLFILVYEVKLMKNGHSKIVSYQLTLNHFIPNASLV